MKISRLIILLFVLFVFFVSCGKVKNEEKTAPPPDADIISSEEMSKVLEDVYLAEAATNRKELAGNSPQLFAPQYFRYALTKNNVTREQFIASYKYYSSEANEMIKILEAIISDLSKKQGLLQADKKNDPAKNK